MSVYNPSDWHTVRRGQTYQFGVGTLELAFVLKSVLELYSKDTSLCATFRERRHHLTSPHEIMEFGIEQIERQLTDGLPAFYIVFDLNSLMPIIRNFDASDVFLVNGAIRVTSGAAISMICCESTIGRFKQIESNISGENILIEKYDTLFSELRRAASARVSRSVIHNGSMKIMFKATEEFGVEFDRCPKSRMYSIV